MGLKGEHLREQVTAELCWMTATLVAREGWHSLWCKPHPGTDLWHGQPVEQAPLTPTNTGFHSQVTKSDQPERKRTMLGEGSHSKACSKKQGTRDGQPYCKPTGRALLPSPSLTV